MKNEYVIQGVLFVSLSGKYADCYLREQGKMSKISTFENYSKYKEEELWQWLVSAYSYKATTQEMDLAVVSEENGFSFDGAAVNFVQESNWTLERVCEHLQKYYQDECFELFYQTEEGEKQMVIDAADSIIAHRVVKRMYLALPYNTVLYDKSKEKSVRAGNDAEEGSRLYRYYNRINAEIDNELKAD